MFNKLDEEFEIDFGLLKSLNTETTTIIQYVQ